MPWSFFFRPARIWIALRPVLVLLVGVFACGLSMVSEASAAGYVKLANSSSGYVYGYYTDGPSACVAGGAYVDKNTTALPLSYNSTSGNCQSATGMSVQLTVISYSSGTPPITCTAPQVLQSDSTGKYGCATPPPNCPAAGQSAPGGNTAYGTSATQTVTNPAVCVNSCSYGYRSYWTGAQPGQSGGFPAEWYGLTSNYASCSGSGMPNALDSKPTSSCPDKTYSGTVNGQNVCVPYPTQTTGGNTSSTTTDSPASGVATSNTGSTSTSTTCDGTTCTTTTVVVGGGSGGSGSGGAASGVAAGPCQSTQVSTGASVNGGPGTCTSTTSQPQTDYCKSNPTAQQCQQNSASGGADCGAPPSCSGDAISCAILAQQWNTRCDLQKSVDPSIQLGQQIQAGNDPMAAQLPTPGKADQVDLSSKLSNVDDMGIVAQCLGNIDVPLQLPGGGWNLHIDTTPLCDMGKLLGYLNVLSTLMLCAYMLKGSF